jgi:hypothetical protein
VTVKAVMPFGATVALPLARAAAFSNCPVWIDAEPVLTSCCGSPMYRAVAVTDPTSCEGAMKSWKHELTPGGGPECNEHISPAWKPNGNGTGLEKATVPAGAVGAPGPMSVTVAVHRLNRYPSGTHDNVVEVGRSPGNEALPELAAWMPSPG